MTVSTDTSNVRGFDARSLAVQVVDDEHGYTIEFSNRPNCHAIDYDEHEQRIAAWLIEAGENLRVIASPALWRHGQPVEILGAVEDQLVNVRCMDGANMLVHVGHLLPVSA